MAASVSQVLQQYGQQYLDRHGEHLTADQRKTLQAVMACRTGALGTIRYQCLTCGHVHQVPRSCANRHCPTCQYEKTCQWLETQQSRLLPCAYFLITFTVPQELRALMLCHPRKGYRALMNAAADALKTAASNERHVGRGTPGFLGVLHTFGRDLTYHPHVHFIVAGGAVDSDAVQGDRWKPSRTDYFVPEKVLSILFRAKLRDALEEAGLLAEVAEEVWQRDFTVDAINVGDGRASLKYLSPYVFRGPVSNWRVTACNNGASLDDATLVLQVKPSGKGHYRPMRLPVEEFIRRWLLHVLPGGFHRVRYYGFLHSHSKVTAAEVRWLIALHNDDLYYLTCSVTLVTAELRKLSLM